MAVKREFTFESGDARTRIHAVEWKPENAEIHAVLQIFHGMVEFIDRYEEFACYLAERGIVVRGSDHLGHGASIVEKEDYGYFSEENGNAVLLGDLHRLQEMTQEEYPDLPYYILGHSMGTFLLRQYLCRYGEELDGAVIMGTGTQPQAALAFGQKLCRMMAKHKGWRYRSRFIDKMAFGGYNKHFKPGRTGKEWLTKDEQKVDAYVADERCSFILTLNGYYNLFYSIEEASKRENMEKMPKDLPILFASGADDPVGGFKKGVDQVRKEFQNLGMTDITWIFYENDRHEILNETDRNTVFRDLYAWLYVRICDPRRKTGGKENENIKKVDFGGIDIDAGADGRGSRDGGGSGVL